VTGQKEQEKSLTSGEQKTKIIDDGQGPNNTETLSGTRTLSGSFLVRRQPEFEQPDCTNHMGLLCGLSASDGAMRTAALRLCNPVAQGPRDATGEYKREVEKELTGRKTEAWEIIDSSFGARRIGAPPLAPWPWHSRQQNSR